MANPFENAFYLVSPLITVSAIIILIAFVWIKAPKNLSQRLFLLLLLSVGLWSLLIFGMRSGSDTNEAHQERSYDGGELPQHIIKTKEF